MSLTSKKYRQLDQISGNYYAGISNDTMVRGLMNDTTTDSLSKVNIERTWSQFDRFYTVDLSKENPSNRHYIFICRPDLYLAKSGTVELSTESGVAYDPYFRYLAQMHPEIIASLTGDFAGVPTLKTVTTTQAALAVSGLGNSTQEDGSLLKFTTGETYNLTMHTFIPFLTPRVESLQLPDYTIKQNVLVQPYTKYSIPYTTSAIESTTGGSFDITFREDKFYSIHKLFYAWIYYQDKVMHDVFKPKSKYLMYNAIDYATSIYDFLVDETGENVIYWAKYTGCVPTSIPMSDLSFNKGGTAEAKISIPFSYYCCEQMDTDILIDFQYNSLGYTACRSYLQNNILSANVRTAPIYNEDTFLGNNFVRRPIVTLKGNQVKLRWLE